ncbi:MAG: hypothetical protein COB17_11065 [Sulfurimonas sp.]|nr:MAG: hypothetical protein COB17_11065 [Sulfurimonas sp.]
MIQGSNKASFRPIINYSLGPNEYGAEVPSVLGGGSYNKSNYGSELASLRAVLSSKIDASKDAIIVMAAGNSATDITSTIVNELSLNPDEAKRIFFVGALDNKGNIADYSNYSKSLGTMIYVPVNGSSENNKSVSGTSFAAPQIHYLINKIYENRPNLTPEELREVLFDLSIAPKSTVLSPNGEMIEVQIY